MTLRPLVPMVALLWWLAAPGLRAQERGAGATRSTIAGSVLAAETGQPLPNAVVVLEAGGDAAVVVAADGPFLRRTLTALTDASGGYRFANLTPGTYRLLVRHLGFRPAFVTVDLAGGSPLRVSVGLIVSPIRLESVNVRTLAGEPFARTRAGADEVRFGRLDADRFRRDQFLESDARVLTHGDVVEAVTLGEADLFRALQRLPGVSTRDDFNSELWTRGAPWGQTRVYFDGLPLFNPVHALGLFAGVHPDAVGSASFHPGVRPAAVGEGAAGVVSVGSRAAAGPGVRGLAELSVVSARAALDLATRDGRHGLMLAGRRSHVDLVTGLLDAFGADSTVYWPYAFYDVVGRGDLALGEHAALEVSGLWEQDALRGGVPGLLRASRGTWGNRVARATLAARIGGLHARTTVGVSRFAGTLASARRLKSGVDDDLSVPQHFPLRNRVQVFQAGTELAPAGSRGRGAWSLGAQLVRQTQLYVGQYPRPYPVIELPETLLLDEALQYTALWGERRWALTAALTLETGLRIEGPIAVRNVPGVALAPRATLRWAPPRGRASLSAGGGRTWQYTQALAPAGPSVGPDLHVTDVWLLAGHTIPAIRADVATVGGELALGGAWVAAATGYVRRETGVAVPDPTPGDLLPTRPIFVAAVNRASGVELSVRRLAGRWTGSLAWALARSELETRGFRYPSPADRRQVVDATLMARIRSLRFGAAATVASGAPFSRFFVGAAPCETVPCSVDTLATAIELPNAVRAPTYASVDLLVDWTRAGRRWSLGVFLQVRNVLNRKNAVTYTGTLKLCSRPNPPTLVRVRAGVCDRFDRGMSMLPLAGVRLGF